MRGRVPAALVAGLVLVLAGCTSTPNQQASNSPAPSPSSAAQSPPATVSPIVAETPSSAPAKPSTAALTIASASFHEGEVSIGYAPITLSAAGGTPPYRWSISAGALPAGLALSSGGKVSGTPATAGDFSFTVRLGDSAGGGAGLGRSITIVRYVAFRGTCTTVCNVEQGCMTVCGGYSSLGGGVTPYKFTITAGSLPPGTSLNGLALVGTFTTVSGRLPYAFTVTVTDAFGAMAKATANFAVFAHVAFTVTTAQCSATVAPGCTTQQLQYANGTPSGTPKVVVTNVNAPNYKNAMPVGFSAVAKGGTIYVSIPAQPNNGNWIGTITVDLVDQSPCRPGSNCSSGSATITVRV